MPVILPAAAHESWLDPGVRDVGALRELLVPFDSDAMTYRPVGRAVNNPRNDGPELLDPIDGDGREK